MTVIKSTHLRKSAQGEECTVNVLHYCNYDTSTTVLAHLPSDISGYKPTDLSSCYCCSSCHDLIDRRVWSDEFESGRDWYLRRAQVRTLTRMLDKGLITVKGAK